MADLQSWADELLAAYAGLDPTGAVVEAGAQEPNRLTDYSPAGHQARADFAAGKLREVAGITAESDHDRRLLDHLAERLESLAEFHDSGEDLRELHAAATGPLAMIRQAVDAAVPADDADAAARETGWALVAERLADVPRALAGYAESLTVAASRGHVASVRQINLCVARCDGWIADTEQLVASYDAGPHQAALSMAATSAAKAYQQMATWLSADLRPQADPKEAFGPDRYAVWLRKFLGVRPDLVELYAWGWAEVAAIEAQLRAEAEAIRPGAGLGEVLDFLDAPGAPGTLTSPAEFADWLQGVLERTVSELDGTQFDIPEPLRRIESRVTTSAGTMYIGPSADLTRPGRVWWQLPDGAEVFPTWWAYSTVYHEGVPGHHLQLGYESWRNPLGQRLNLLGGLSAGQEGWALYAERLMDELGWYTQPGARLGYLFAQLLRAARVVIDIGLHLELPDDTGRTWTADAAYEMLANRCQQGGYASSELARYLGRPAQALAYKAGERVWLDARTASGLPLREFHRRALDLGSLGLGQLAAALR
ncbi:MAG: DUF885 domain-containing protein [Hamadaea sp.]|uniref:DUF885 domain-containing protein n=1 Tax=Hamadaea sp. TaxID=2024425 RepID=UPI0017F93154|nr:DUF885 domain-containing protein [Hamadaea sp.]NUT20585.1 DUF885 domain-containing protein [Hamadaea sp.]